MPVFVFDDPPTSLVVYPSLDDARGSLESLDVAGIHAAFTAAGQVVDVTPGDDLFAQLKLSERYELSRLHQLLREVRGPSHLADDPAAYAQEWLRLDAIDAQWPPVVPAFVRRWLESRSRSTGNGS